MPTIKISYIITVKLIDIIYEQYNLDLSFTETKHENSQYIENQKSTTYKTHI